MIATKKPLTKTAAEIDLAATINAQPKPEADASIKSKRPRLRGRARADVAKNIAPTIDGPKSKKSPTLAVGTKLVRVYRGKKITVVVRSEREFEHNGTIYTSLSALACKLSGTHCSGYRWFGLTSAKATGKK
jgi:hypothetical protein